MISRKRLLSLPMTTFGHPGLLSLVLSLQAPGKRLSKETSEKDEFDMMLSDKEMNRSLSEKLGVNKKEILKKPSSKQAKKKTKSPWSDSESGDSSH